ncbi:hypothetical protein [Gimesia fumaroli]|uniref:Rhamnogalacturonan lyase domain-containing protein n=1 Tax=Gimesia fumaroli TaxID=2527976 RepID=A0A518I6A7_9PLAN|nr:hypothetical protein [Gimesia fumaroli]QDV48642.1 hypothetical protein Enr17x_06550 [Gimesia fumaroli]
MQKINMSQILIAAVLVSGMSLLSPATVSAEGWGSITGRIVYDGDVPKPAVERKKGDPTVKDTAVCAATDHLFNDLVINADNKGVQNAFLYLRKVKEIHPDLKESKEKTVVFDQKGCTFFPHAMVVRTDQNVLVKSNDPVAHNTHTFPFRNEAVNFILAPNDRVGKEVSNPIGERLPFKVTCDIHPFMTAYWFVVDHPYAVVSDKDGKFTIKNLPEGENEFRVWHEKGGYIVRSLDVDVKAGETVDVGEIKVSPSKFK